MNKSVKLGAIAATAVIVIIAAVIFLVKPPAVECIVLEENILENTFNEIGEVIPLAEADVYTKSGGRLVEVRFEEGSSVKAGDLLFIFDDKDLANEEKLLLGEIAVLDSQINSQIVSLRMQISALDSEKVSLEIQVDKAQIDEARLSKEIEAAIQLHDLGAISSQELSDARVAYELASKGKELATSTLEHIQSQIVAVDMQLQDLLGQKSSSESTIIGSTKHSLLAQRDAYESRLSLIREEFAELMFYAAMDGIIRDMPLKAGQIVYPGTKLCSIYQGDNTKVDCYILVENISGIKTGDEVRVKLQLRDEDKEFTGIITRVALDAVDKISKVGLNEKRIKIEIAVTEEGWSSIGAYWPVEVRFILDRSTNCLIVPKTALFEDIAGNWRVWLVRDGKVVAIPIERGVQTPSQVEIKGDVRAGDRIIRNAKTSKAVEGQKVRAII